MVLTTFLFAPGPPMPDTLIDGAEALTNADAPGDLPRQSTFAALHDANFARYCAAYIPSMTGTWIRITAIGYLVYDITSDPLKLGVISFATSAPQLILSPLSGAFIDRVNRRNLLVTVQLLIVAVMAVTAFLIGNGQITYPLLLVIAVILGSLITFDWPVRLALIPALVDRPVLQNAIALNTTMFNISKVFGPTLAGWLIALVGMTWAFGVTALLMVPFPLVLLTIPRLKLLAPAVSGQEGSGYSQLIAGYRYIGRTPRIAALMLMNLVPVVLGMSYITMAPAYVSDVLKMDAATLGYLMAINGIGSVLGTFSIARYTQMRQRGTWILRVLAAFAGVPDRVRAHEQRMGGLCHDLPARTHVRIRRRAERYVDSATGGRVVSRASDVGVRDDHGGVDGGSVAGGVDRDVYRHPVGAGDHRHAGVGVRAVSVVPNAVAIDRLMGSYSFRQQPIADPTT